MVERYPDARIQNGSPLWKYGRSRRENGLPVRSGSVETNVYFDLRFTKSPV